MCKKTQFKYCPSEIDGCMKNFMDHLKGSLINEIQIKACCCGHGVYPMTIIIKRWGAYYDLISGEEITRKRNFYKRDKQGYYYIPETLNQR